jgi:hypothetical protein
MKKTQETWCPAVHMKRQIEWGADMAADWWRSIAGQIKGMARKNNGHHTVTAEMHTLQKSFL